MATPAYRLEHLARHHRKDDFNCGEPSLDRYLQRQARQDVDRRVTAVYVMIDTTSEAVAGYFTLSSGDVESAKLPADLRQRLPRYPELPVLVLGRLAIDRRFQGQGLGTTLLLRALRRAYELSREVGAMAVVVDAIDDRARRLYERQAFQQFDDDPRRLFLPMETIKRLVGDR